jgi:hypothetical protein
MNHLVTELAGSLCRCGREKKKGNTFCRLCYFSLPRILQLKLYRKVGNGYEEAYQEAVECLKEIKVLKAGAR